MGIVISAFFGVVGAGVTNYVLRNELGVARIVLAIAAGMIVGVVVTFLMAFAIFYVFDIDLGLYALIGSLLAPPLTALAAWRWRPKKVQADDLRAP